MHGLCQGTAPGFIPNQVKPVVYLKALEEDRQLVTVLQDTDRVLRFPRKGPALGFGVLLQGMAACLFLNGGLFLETCNRLVSLRLSFACRCFRET